MTSTSPPESDPSCTADARGRVSYLSGNWMPHEHVRLSVDDVGFRQGVTAVERLRTYCGRILALRAHLDRWQHSTGELGIDGLPSRDAVRSLMEELLTRNASLLQAEGDIGITMFATPGEVGGNEPTFSLHPNQLDHDRISRHRAAGQPLVVTDIRQPDPGCWPRTIKVRSRIHYYLADKSARRQDDDAVGVLIDSDGSVTETSIANLAIVHNGRIISPPADRVLRGITQSIVESLASQAGIAWSRNPISVKAFAEADEVLMMGTNGGIWFANSINGNPVGSGRPGRLLISLRERFDQYVVQSVSGESD